MEETIIALITPSGLGAVAVLRISGPEAFVAVQRVFKGKKLSEQPSHSIVFGTIWEEGVLIDEVLLSLFRGPRSYTGEDVVEISCHGSPYIVRRLTELFMRQGLRYAKAGEFTQRAFLNGKFDLAQAEAVADLIASDSEIGHRAAMNQMRGGFSQEIKTLREQLIHFASLIELELDFSEEDVEFASRLELKVLVERLQGTVRGLSESFKLGNVIKNGVPTVIAGKPNAGKSTLLNALLNEEKAIVSDIPGTTRDFIEDQLHISGISFRLIDTAGLRQTDDRIEAIGVQRTYSKMKEASLILYIFDTETATEQEIDVQVQALRDLGAAYLLIANKIDRVGGKLPQFLQGNPHVIGISAQEKMHLEELKQRLLEMVQLDQAKAGSSIVTNLRHYEALLRTDQALQDVLNGLARRITGDFLALDIRTALHHLGEITGQITHEDLLDNIFSKFCIGK